MTVSYVYHAIRMAMMGGILLFAGVSWFMHRSPDWQPATAALSDGMAMIGRVMWGVAAAALMAFFFLRRRAETPARASALAISAWSVGEALALFGVVHFYLTGNSAWTTAGIIGMAITFVAFPPPAPAVR